MSPYKIMSTKPQPAQRSILISPPLDPFTGFVSAFRHRHDIFLSLVACTAVLSEFLPLLLGAIPWRVSETYLTHQVCTWLAVAVLALMVAVLVGSLFLRWPSMPVDPSTVAGSIYYVCESDMVDEFRGMGWEAGDVRDSLVGVKGKRYVFKEKVGIGNRRRMQVEVDDGLQTDF